jgi:hypothetical protein
MKISEDMLKTIERNIKEAEEYEMKQIKYHLAHTCENDEERLLFMNELAKLYGIEEEFREKLKKISGVKEKELKEIFGEKYDFYERR